jgi:hypothetical protein
VGVSERTLPLERRSALEGLSCRSAAARVQLQSQSQDAASSTRWSSRKQRKWCCPTVCFGPHVPRGPHSHRCAHCSRPSCASQHAPLDTAFIHWVELMPALSPALRLCVASAYSIDPFGCALLSVGITHACRHPGASCDVKGMFPLVLSRWRRGPSSGGSKRTR